MLLYHGRDGNIHQIINCLIRHKIDIPIVKVLTEYEMDYLDLCCEKLN